jgi:hypothetical protein
MFSRLSLFPAKQQPGLVASAGCKPQGTGFPGSSCIICVLALCLGVSILASFITTSPSHATARLLGPISSPSTIAYLLIAIIIVYCSYVALTAKALSPTLDNPRKLEQQLYKLHAQTTPHGNKKDSAQQHALTDDATASNSAAYSRYEPCWQLQACMHQLAQRGNSRVVRVVQPLAKCMLRG